MFDVITMGSSTVDAFADTEGDEYIDIKTANTEEELIAYPLGSKIVIKEMRYDVGGNGVNVAVAVSRLGMKTAYLGKVGNDMNGDQIINRLGSENVEFIGARGDQSGFSVILDSTMGNDRTILTYKGCNNDLRLEEVDFDQINAKWIYFSSMLEESMETMKEVARVAKERGIKIAFNPSSTITRKGIDFVKPILEKTDLLVLNDEEASDLVGRGSVEENLRKFLEKGIDKVVITMGDEGLKATDGEHIYVAKPTEGCEVLETTGAGDACSAGILAGSVYGKDVETCIRMGMINAESVLCNYGAHNQLLNMEEIEQRLQDEDRHFEKNPI